jgi:chitin synthase
MKNMVNQKQVTAHVFEYTTSFALDPSLHFKFPDKGIVPTQIIFCMKEKNQKKINSHRWGFNAFGAMLQVNITRIFHLVGESLTCVVAECMRVVGCGYAARE